MVSQELYYNCSPFLTFFSTQFTDRNVYSIPHEGVTEINHCQSLSADWMQIIHGTNIANVFREPINNELFIAEINKNKKMVGGPLYLLDKEKFKDWSGFSPPDFIIPVRENPIEYLPNYPSELSQKDITNEKFFDESWYKNAHPDVTSAIANGIFESGWHHYQLHGKKEGRAAKNLVFNESSFNEAWYRARYPDVAIAIAKGLFKSGWQHYQLHGRNESRFACPGKI